MAKDIIELNSSNVTLSHWLPKRPSDATKWDYGHLLVVGGDHGFGGAVRLAGEAALRTGAGMVSILTRIAHTMAVLAGCPELMVHGSQPSKQKALLAHATALVIGPGLGQLSWGRSLWKNLKHNPVQKVVDADGLNLLSEQPMQQDNWVLTPHLKEAARLLACSVEAVQADRKAAIVALQAQYGGIVVLKGEGSLIKSSGPEIYRCALGNPGMATAGMGDILSGIIGGLLAQKLPLLEAAKIGVYVHALAADKAAEQGQRGLKAGDLLPLLRGILN